MRKERLKGLAIVAWALLAVALASPRACGQEEVVFDNTVHELGLHKHLSDSFLEMGDDATLAGSAREITGVAIGFYSVSSGSFAELTLHLYDSTLVPLGNPVNLTGIAFAEDTFPTVSFPVPNYTAPDDIVWTLSYTGATFRSLPGPQVCAPPVVGSSLDTFMVDRGSGLQAEYTTGSPASFWTRVKAVPEPATLSLVVVGVWAVWTKRRRKA